MLPPKSDFSPPDTTSGPTGVHSPLSTLPPELIDQVVSFVGQKDQVALCRVSRFFHSVSITHLYRHISISSIPSILGCCLAINANGAAAVAVRSLTISPGMAWGEGTSRTQHLPSDTLETITTAFQQLSNIETLLIDVADDSYTSVLQNATFPWLYNFRCRLDLSNSLVEFLNRHPHLIQLQLERQNVFSPIPPVLPPLKLPMLRSFVGDAVYLPHVVQESSLGGAMAAWNGVEDDASEILDALGKSSSDSLMVLACRRRGWNLDLFEAISTQLPDIICLDLMNVLMVDAFPSQDALDSITAMLSRFTRLRKFTFKCMNILENHIVTIDQLDRDFKTVITWGIECPSLHIISLPHSPNWFRVTDDFWVPDSSDAHSQVWFDGMLKSDRLPEIRPWFRGWYESLLEEMSENPGFLIDGMADIMGIGVQTFIDFMEFQENANSGDITMPSLLEPDPETLTSGIRRSPGRNYTIIVRQDNPTEVQTLRS